MELFSIIKSRVPLFLFFGGINYFFSYTLFVILWFFLAEDIGYIGVAILNTTISTFEAYMVQNRLVWKKSHVRFGDYFKYLCYQFIILPFSIFMVPYLADLFEISILFIQFIYSLILTLSTWFFLKLFIYKDNL
jgi:hypothetical protein